MSDSDSEEYCYSSGDESADECGGSDDSQGPNDDGPLDPDVELENKFWEADDDKKSAPEKALATFKQYLADDLKRSRGEVDGKPAAHLEIDGSIGYFQVLHEVTLINFRLGSYDGMLVYYRQMLNFLPNVTRNERQKAIENILRAISSSRSGSNGCSKMSLENQQILVNTYRLTLEILEKLAIDARLTFSTKRSLGQLYLQLHDTTNVEAILRDLHAACKDEHGNDNISGKAEWLLEMSALEIQLCAITGDVVRRKRAHARTKLLGHAIVDPSTMGIIHEDAGKMFMAEKKWKLAYDEFFNGFKKHSETANPRANACLKYVVLANMLSLSKISPFHDNDAKAYENTPDIRAMVELRQAYDSGDARKFESILRDPATNLLGDAFIAEYVDDLLQQTRQDVLRQYVIPYRRVRLKSIAMELNIKEEDIEPLIVRMILDGKLEAKIDQETKVLNVGGGEGSGAADMSERFAALDRWADALSSMLE